MLNKITFILQRLEVFGSDPSSNIQKAEQLTIKGLNYKIAVAIRDIKTIYVPAQITVEDPFFFQNHTNNTNNSTASTFPNIYKAWIQKTTNPTAL